MKEHVTQCNSLARCVFDYIDWSLDNNGALWHKGVIYTSLWIHRLYLSVRQVGFADIRIIASQLYHKFIFYA